MSSYIKLEDELTSRGNSVNKTLNWLKWQTTDIEELNLKSLSIMRRFKASEERQKAGIIIKTNTKLDLLSEVDN